MNPASAGILRGVSASYGSRQVLREVSAQLPRAQITAIVGANGAGKSSLLNVIAGVLPVSAGSVELTDSRRPAYVTQRSEVSDALPITVRSTVTMGRWAHRGPWRRIAPRDRAVVEESMVRLDIAHLARRQLGSLSGGQRQRVLVAQGLAQEADLLILDEPAAGLDLNARSRIDEALALARNDGVTVLRVTHDLATANHCEHCLLLRDGSVVAEGQPRAVLTPDRVAAAWGLPGAG